MESDVLQISNSKIYTTTVWNNPLHDYQQLHPSRFYDWHVISIKGPVAHHPRRSIGKSIKYHHQQHEIAWTRRPGRMSNELMMSRFSARIDPKLESFRNGSHLAAPTVDCGYCWSDKRRESDLSWLDWDATINNILTAGDGFLHAAIIYLHTYYGKGTLAMIDDHRMRFCRSSLHTLNDCFRHGFVTVLIEFFNWMCNWIRAPKVPLESSFSVGTPLLVTFGCMYAEFEWGVYEA